MCGRVQLDLEIGGPAMRRLSQLLQKQFPAATISSGEKFPADLLPVLIHNSAATDKPPGNAAAEAGETASQKKAELALMRWGFRLSGSGKLLINARAETAAEKPLFRQSLLCRRCVLPTSGFYEWSHDGGKKKYLFRREGEPLLYLAGIFRQEEDGPRFVVLTQAANDTMAPIHDRMPLILGQRELPMWLSDSDQAPRFLSRVGPALIRIAQ